ncbi:MAG: alpha/beta fold hydrolase [Tepidiformaceae bacterium]
MGLPSAWPGNTFSERMRWFADWCTPEPNSEHIRKWAHDILLRSGAEFADQLMLAGDVSDLDLATRLPEVKVPTLIVSGTLDPLVTEAALEFIHSQIPGSKVAMIDGAGHLPFMTRPEEVAAAINDFFAM